MIRSSDVRPWVAHSVTVALSLVIFIGLGVYSRESMTGAKAELAKEIFTGCRWAAITCAVVAGPVTGALAQTSLERVLGTVIGGFCGFLVCWMAQPIANAWEWILYALMAGMFGWAAVYMGHRLSLNYSFKLAIITFLLVFAGADDLGEAQTIALTRTLGITAGVTMTLILSVSILPVSAHHQHEEALNMALHSLLSLQALCWVPLTHTHQPGSPPKLLSPTPTAHLPAAGCSAQPEHSPNTSANAENHLGSEAGRSDTCAKPLLSPRSMHASPYTSPTRSGQQLQDNPSDDVSMLGGSGFFASGAGGTLTASWDVSTAAAPLSPAQQTLLSSRSAPASDLPLLSPTRQAATPGAQIGAGADAGVAGLVGSKSCPQEAFHRSSFGSGGGSVAGLVKRSEFASVNWEMHNLKLDEDGDIRSAEDIVVEVYSALSAAEASLAIAEREIYAGRIFGRPFYIPRFIASLVCLGGTRSVPKQQAKAACGAARGAARVLLGLHSLLKEGTDSVVKEVLHERYPGALMPDIVKFSGLALQDCIEAYNRGEVVCGSSLELLRSTVSTLISISGAHRSRIHHQYQTYRALAHDLRARLYARTPSTHSSTPSRRDSVHAQHGSGAVLSFWGAHRGSHSQQSLIPTAAGGSETAAVATGASCNSSRGEGNWGGKLWRLLSGRLSTSIGRHPTLATSGALQRAAEEPGMTQPLLQVCTERGTAGSRLRTSNSSSDRSTPASRNPPVTSPFSAQQAHDPFCSHDSVRLSFGVHRDAPPPPPRQPSAQAVPPMHAAEQQSGGEEHMQHGTPLATAGADSERATTNVYNYLQKPFHLAPSELQQPAASISRSSCALPSLPEQRPDKPKDSQHMHASHATWDDATADPPRDIECDARHSAGGGSERREAEACAANMHAAHEPFQGTGGTSSVRSRVLGCAMDGTDRPYSTMLSSFGHPSQQHSLGESMPEGGAHRSRSSSGRDASECMDTVNCATSAAAMAASARTPPSRRSLAPLTRGASGPGALECGRRARTASGADLSNPPTAKDVGAFGVAPARHLESDRALFPGTHVFAQPGGEGQGGSAWGASRTAPTPQSHAYNSTAPRVPHSAAPTAPVGVARRPSCGELGEASRLLARSGTQPMLMFPDTPEGYYAEITYYTFQFHLEEIVDATKRLQAALCDLIAAMPRNAPPRDTVPRARASDCAAANAVGSSLAIADAQSCSTYAGWGPAAATAASQQHGTLCTP